MLKSRDMECLCPTLLPSVVSFLCPAWGTQNSSSLVSLRAAPKRAFSLIFREGNSTSGGSA